MTTHSLADQQLVDRSRSWQVIKLRQPQGMKRRKLNDDEPCSAYEIYRVDSSAILGESRRVDLGWEFRMDGAAAWTY